MVLEIEDPLHYGKSQSISLQSKDPFWNISFFFSIEEQQTFEQLFMEEFSESCEVDIKVMSVEILHGPGKPALKRFLESKGYKEIVYLPGEKIVDWDIMVQKKEM